MKKIKSPCTDKCKYDGDKVCMGCHRTMHEIVNWPDFSDDIKLEIINRVSIKMKKLTDKITELTAKNPCIRDCEYDDNNICLACHRTKKEIFEWGYYTDEERIEINKRISNKFRIK